MSLSTRNAVAMIAVAETLVWAGLYYSFPALIEQWRLETGWGLPQITGALTVSLLVSSAMAPLVGRLIDDGFGPALMTAATALGGATMLLLSQAQTLWQFYFLWIVLGVAIAGSLYEPCFALITRAEGRNATKSIVPISLVAGFAGTISFPLGHVMADIGGWRLAVTVYGAIVLLVAVPAMWFSTRHFEQGTRMRRPPSGEAGARAADRRAHLSKPVFWLLAAAFALLVMNHGIVINHILPLLGERGFSETTAVIVAAAIGPMQVVGRIAMMMAQRRVSLPVITLCCFAGIALATVMLIGSAFLPVLVALFVLLQGASHGVTSIARPAITRELLGEKNFGAISGSLALPYMASVALAPTVGSLLWLAGGYQLVLVVILAAAIAGGIACLAAIRRAKTR